MKRILPTCLLLAACTAGLDGDGVPTVLLETETGDIQIDVYPDRAPISAEDFLLHVEEGLYDGQSFYRVVRADNDPRGMGMSLIQGGRTDREMVRPTIAHERTTDIGLSNTRGSVSIARLEPGTGSAGFFFINIGDNGFLDTGGSRNPDGEGYAVFGRVVSGMDVVEAIQAGDTRPDSDDAATRGQMLAAPVIITRAVRLD